MIPAQDPLKTANSGFLQSLQQPLVQYLLLYLVVLCVFLPTFWYAYVWDDFAGIVRNESLREWKNIPRYFTDPSTFIHDPYDTLRHEWRPFRNIYFLVTFKLHHLHPAGWHFQHVLLHCLVSAVVLAFFHRLWRYAMNLPADEFLPVPVQLGLWFAVLGWAIHPVNTEVTAWLKSADDLLSCLITFSALMILFPIGKPLNYGRTVAGALLFSTAFLAKESIAPVPAIFPIVYVLLAPNWRLAMRHKPMWAATILMFAGLGTYMILRTRLLGQLEQVPYMAGNFSLMMATMTTAAVRYLQLTFWPFWPTVQIGDYLGWPVATSWNQPNVVFSVCLLLMVAVIVVVIARRSKVFATGLAFAVLAFLPVANIVPMMQVMAERFLYFPLTGAALSVSAIYSYSIAKHGKALTFIPVVVCIALGWTTISRLPVWSDQQSFAMAATSALPDNPRALYNKAVQVAGTGNTTNALVLVLEAERGMPGNYHVGMAAAQLYHRLGFATSATRQLDKMNSKFPEKAGPLILQGDIARMADDYEQAVQYYKQAVQLDSNIPRLWYYLGESLFNTGNYSEAVDALMKASENKDLATSSELLMRQITDRSTGTLDNLLPKQ